MAANSANMMKEYLKKQLKYWVEDFKEEMLPRDFASKTFNRSQITLTKLHLKVDKVAALLRISAPILVTRAYCTEVVIKVPSWSVAEKFVQEPLSIRMGDLFLDLKNEADCAPDVVKQAQLRANNAHLEPDPLGSIASMYAFANIIYERLEISIENVYIKIFIKGVSRIRVELTAFHARTTNALWQDMRDLTSCVDRSPDGLLRTRFKFVSFTVSISLQAPENAPPSTPAQLHILQDHTVALRMTLFGHRKSKNVSWETLSQVIDVNLETLSFDYELAQLIQMYEIPSTLFGWIREEADRTSKATVVNADAAGVGVQYMHRRQQVIDDDEETESEHASFALQVTFRFTIDATFRVKSERIGTQRLQLTSQNTAVNLIVHHNNIHEVQLTLHELSVRFQDALVFYLKPDREVMQIKQLRESLFVKWRLQTLLCNIEGDLALIMNEIYHSRNEKQQAAFIKCGSCNQQILLESIETHVCSVRSPSSSNAENQRASVGNSRKSTISDESESTIVHSSQLRKIRIILHMDELELNLDSHLFHNVQQLMRSAAVTDHSPRAAVLPDRKFALRLQQANLTTESKEFVGDAAFVPVLPLAFQMLECTLKCCGCTHEERSSRKDRSDTSLIAPSGHIRWPDRVFLDIAHFAMTAHSPSRQLESSIIVDKIHLRSSFSDDQRICISSHPQLSFHIRIDRVRCNLDYFGFQFLYMNLGRLQDPFGTRGMFKIVRSLFFGVFQLRTIEYTLQQQHDVGQPRWKSLLKQIAVVVDNQLGYLSTQSTVDFRTLVNSQLLRFLHHERCTNVDIDVNGKNEDVHEPVDRQEKVQKDCQLGVQTLEQKLEARRMRQNRAHNIAVRRIQRKFRYYLLNGRNRRSQINHQHMHAPDSNEAYTNDHLDQTLESTRTTNSCDAMTPQKGTQSPENHRLSSSTSSSIFRSPEELVNTKRVVAAATVFRDGLTKYVKGTQQLIESEVSELAELATQSKESAARLLPRYSAYKKILGTMVSGASEQQDSKNVTAGKIDAETRAASLSSVSGSVDTPMELILSEVEGSSSHEGITPEVTGSAEKNHSPNPMVNIALNEEDAGRTDEELSDVNHQPRVSAECVSIDDVNEQEVADGEVEQGDHSNFGASTEKEPIPDFGLQENLLDALPPVMRVLVQIDERRMCVPINPREKVGYLCREIVRRYNEMFADSGYLSSVSLHDQHGGVFAASDIVGFIYPSETELLFAYPKDQDGNICSFAHLDRSAKLTGTRKAISVSSKIKSHVIGSKFSRCSKLPLPLAIALLANESERDLLSLVMKEGSYGGAGGGKIDEWPELALNASFLDPKNLLEVEVRWFGKCVEVTNIDAFVLCLQQLGLCTSRQTSKYVGKILRDRLKMDPANPLIASACQPKETKASRYNESDVVSYESLKEIVQEDYGVYLNSS